MHFQGCLSIKLNLLQDIEKEADGMNKHSVPELIYMHVQHDKQFVSYITMKLARTKMTKNHK